MLYTITEIRELVFKYKTSKGDTLQDVLDFCELVIFDKTYSKQEREDCESLYKVLIFARLRLHETRIENQTNISEDPFETEHKVSPNISRMLYGNLRVARQNARFKYAYEKKRYNF